MSDYSVPQWAKAFGLVSGLFFIVCFFWGYLITSPELQIMHMDLMRISFPGFTGRNAASALIGIVECIVYGLVLGAALAKSLNFFARR